ncbi:MAG TPA: hypothetical protein VFA52_04670 [Candidatus Paceibacterota bacterium]|jgi:hypothetical protein|nr:hypothetical protein [Candidatus Paceibacterota bacterium]
MTEPLNEHAHNVLEQRVITPVADITSAEIHKDKETGTYQFSDRAALKLVLDDASLADNYANINQWASQWAQSLILLQSPQSAAAFDGVFMSSVPKFTLSNHISSIVPKIMEGLFYEDPPFLLRPRPGTKQELVRAKTALFSAQLWDMKFEEEVEAGLEQMALFGTCIFKWGYLERDDTVKKYRRKSEKVPLTSGLLNDLIDTPDSDDYEILTEVVKISRPWFKCTDIRTVLVDPGCRVGDIRKAKWVIYRDYATFDDLNALREVPGYDIPDEEALKSFFLSNEMSGPDNITMTIPEGMRGYLQQALPRNFRTSADHLQNPMEILERWDADKVIVVLSFGGKNILIRNEPNPYGKIPFYSANWRNLVDSFYGQGLGQLIGAEQVVEQGVTNLSLDLLAYGLQPTAVRKKGFNVPTQMVRWKQGGIIDVDDDVDKAFKFLQMPNVPGEAWAFIQQAQGTAQQTSGANEQVMMGAGSAGIKTTGMRTATGASAIIQANASRLDGPSGRFVRQVFVPWLYQMDELNNDLLPTSVLRRVLGEELGNEYMVDHVEFRNARFEYEVLAGGHLGAKKEMAQFLPIVVQLLNNPTFVKNVNDAGYQFNAAAIFKAFADAAGWKFSQDFLEKMTPEQQQKYEANSPAALQVAQAQIAQQLQTQKFEQEKELEDQRQLGKAGAEVLRQATEHSLQSEIGREPPPGSYGFETAL